MSTTLQTFAMRIASFLCVLLALGLLASCASTGTSIVTRQRLDKDAVGKLAYERIDATSTVRQFTQADLDQLKDAVRTRVSQPASGGHPVTVQLTVTDYGAGGSKMIVRVRVVDAAGNSYAQFDIYQSANTVMGMLDQRSSDISAVADAVARSLNTVTVAPPATTDSRNFGS